MRRREYDFPNRQCFWVRGNSPRKWGIWGVDSGQSQKLEWACCLEKKVTSHICLGRTGSSLLAENVLVRVARETSLGLGLPRNPVKEGRGCLGDQGRKRTWGGERKWKWSACNLSYGTGPIKYKGGKEEGWGDGSAVKTLVVLQRTRFSARYLHGSAQLSVTPVLGCPVPSPDLCGHQVHTQCIKIHVNKTYMHIT